MTCTDIIALIHVIACSIVGVEGRADITGAVVGARCIVAAILTQTLVVYTFIYILACVRGSVQYVAFITYTSV